MVVGSGFRRQNHPKRTTVAVEMKSVGRPAPASHGESGSLHPCVARGWSYGVARER